MFRRKSAAEKLFDSLAESIKTEPEQWFVKQDPDPYFGNLYLIYKKAPDMVFDFDRNDGEVTPREPEEIRPKNEVERRAYKRLKAAARKQFLDTPNENAAQGMLNMFLGQEYTIMPLPKHVTAELHSKLAGMKNGTLVTKKNVWFPDKKDAAFFRLCCEEFDKR